MAKGDFLPGREELVMPPKGSAGYTKYGPRHIQKWFEGLDRRRSHHVEVLVGQQGKMEAFPIVVDIWGDEAVEFCCKKTEQPGVVCQQCYFVVKQSCFRRTLPLPAWRNAQAVKQGQPPLMFSPWMDKKMNIVRFNSFGELGTIEEAVWILRTIKQNPMFTCTLFTKRPGLVHQALDVLKMKAPPKNAILIKSSLHLNEQDELPKHFHKVFTVYDPDTARELEQAGKKTFVCSDPPVKPGQKPVTRLCLRCRVCYTPGGPKEVNEVLR